MRSTSYGGGGTCSKPSEYPCPISAAALLLLRGCRRSSAAGDRPERVLIFPRTDSTQRLTERLRMKGEKRKELVFCVIFVPRLLSDEHGRDHALSTDPTSATRPRPSGSWTTRVYEDGVHIGEWLSLQYDPESEDYSDARKALVRFRPKNAAWTWA